MVSWHLVLGIERYWFNAEALGVFPQHRDHGRVDKNLTAGAIASLPLRLSGREQLRDAWRPFAAADALRGVRRLRTEPVEIAEMRNIDRDK